MKRDIHYLLKKIVSYEELMGLPNDACIRVNSSYFYFLMAKQGLLKLEDPKISHIFSKYIKIEQMQDYLRGYLFVSRYFIMTVDEIRYLITILCDVPSSPIFLLKSDMKAFELDKYYNTLKDKFIEKKINDEQLLVEQMNEAGIKRNSHYKSKKLRNHENLKVV